MGSYVPVKEMSVKVLNFFFFQGFFTQLHELRSLRGSFPQFIYDLFHISLTIFLDRDGHLRVERWRKIMGCCFVSGKSYLSFFFTFPVILERPRFVEIQKFCYHGNVT